jgi:hypothetical protein
VKLVKRRKIKAKKEKAKKSNAKTCWNLTAHGHLGANGSLKKEKVNVSTHLQVIPHKYRSTEVQVVPLLTTQTEFKMGTLLLLIRSKSFEISAGENSRRNGGVICL